jgi:predicted Rossmann-fold nucleotide-binding protein
LYIEIHTVEELIPHLKRKTLQCLVVQGLDLRALSSELLQCPGTGSAFLGCQLQERIRDHLQQSGALIFPSLDNLPYRPFRPRLYSIEELMGGYVRGQVESFYTETLDSRIYRHYTAARGGKSTPILETLAQRLHDHAIDDALSDLLIDGETERRVVGVMGGHAMRRDEETYRIVARVAWRLARSGLFVTTGGGPGAMEAANLGAWMSRWSEAELDEAVSMLAFAPKYDHPGWFDAAFMVRDRWHDGVESLAIPTWFYGHEPSNLFSTHIAKYFANSLREDGLLALATWGIVFAPGSAGTIQEIFQDAAQNHYGTFKVISPMVFLGRTYWTEERPVYPLLRQLAEGRKYHRMITISDDLDEIVTFIENNPPVPFADQAS